MGVAANLGRYRVVSRLGSGGMSAVELAEDTLLGRRVALKRMHASDDVRNRSRLRREALIGASLTHPNLVSIFDIVTTEDGRDVIVMEYVEGQTLAYTLRSGKLDPARALEILTGAGAALDAIHAERIIHRDVKPGNILLGRDGSVKLADLGIAAVPDRTRITSDDAVLGTFSYMAPEQLEGAVATPAVDVYALAAVAYEALSGVKARNEPNPVALAHAISTQPPPDIRTVWPNGPEAVSKVLIRGMSRDPSERPRSAGELTARLKAALAPEPTVAFEPKPPRPSRRQEPDRPRPRSALRPGASAAAVVPAAREAGGPSATPAITSRPAGAATSAPGKNRSSPAASPRERVQSPSVPPSRNSRRRAIVGGCLALAAVAAAAIALATQSGSSHSPSSAASASSSRAAKGSSGHAAAGTASTAGAQSGSNSAPSSSGAAGSATTGVPGAGTPVAAVESFYHQAAAHQYSNAWALADPSFRDQLGGYTSFQSGQAAERSITFNAAGVLSQSRTAASVAIRTTSVRDNDTQHCSGTVDLVRGSSSTWLLHQIHITCV
jgi:serine/threonine protein kinase